MKKPTAEQVINIGGKAAAVVIFGAGLTGSILIGKALLPIKMNPLLKFAGTYFIGHMIGDYTTRKAGEAWNAGATYKAQMEALEKAIAEAQGELGKEEFVNAARELLDELESATEAGEGNDDTDEGEVA